MNSVGVGALVRGSYTETAGFEVLTVQYTNVEEHAVQGGYVLHYRVRHLYKLNRLTQAPNTISSFR